MEQLKRNALDLGLLWLRILTGVGIANHGYAKIFGGHLPMLTDGLVKMGLPMPGVFAWLASLSEFAGGLLIATGFLTRPAAFFVFCTMTVAAFVAHANDPLQVKELAFAYWTVSGALMLTGAGRFSFDNKFLNKIC